jgi:hypothetical protein
MTQAAAQAAAFFTEAVASGTVWTLKDEGGYPAPMNGSGQRAQPFWSKQSRAQKIVDNAPAYAGFQVVAVPLAEFEGEWLGELQRDGLLVGVNWSGKRVLGYDYPPPDVARRLDYERKRIA